MSTKHVEEVVLTRPPGGAEGFGSIDSPDARNGQSESRIGAIRVLLAEPHGIRSVLEQIHDVELIAAVNYEKDLARMISKRHPHVVLFAMGVSGLDNLSVIGRIHKKFPAVRLIIMGHSFTPEYVSHALRAGVSGFLSDQSTVAHVKRALKVVLAGRTHVPPRFPVRRSDRTGKSPDQPAGAATATPRQREVLELIAAGKNTKEVATIMRISSKTVEAHRIQLMKRLRIHNLPGLVRYAFRTGLARLDI
jgi:DNA-binding NarL/FixJ family response regulator